MFFHDLIVILCMFVFFFFKQKTAYEMRISDWSSEVCSSDLAGCRRIGTGLKKDRAEGGEYGFRVHAGAGGDQGVDRRYLQRSEERRVGQECVRTCRFRCSPSP